MIDAQTKPNLLAGVIAPSPDVLIIIEAMLSWRPARHKRTQRLSVRILGSVLLQHQFAVQYVCTATNAQVDLRRCTLTVLLTAARA
jgi:hypothetical protein